MKEITYDDLVKNRVTGRDCNWDFPARKSRKMSMKFKELPKEVSGDLFLKLKPDETVQGIFQGDPYEFFNHWTGERSVDCSGEHCKHCEKGDKPRFRFRINFVMKDEQKNYVVKIWDQGRRVYETLRGLSADYDLERTIVKVTRHGSGKNDTNYPVTPVPPPKGEFTKELATQLQKLKLHDLANPIQDAGESENEEMDSVPF